MAVNNWSGFTSNTGGRGRESMREPAKLQYQLFCVQNESAFTAPLSPGRPKLIIYIYLYTG